MIMSGDHVMAKKKKKQENTVEAKATNSNAEAKEVVEAKAEAEEKTEAKADVKSEAKADAKETPKKEKGFKAFLKRKDIEISLKRYGIDELWHRDFSVLCLSVLSSIL